MVHKTSGTVYAGRWVIDMDTEVRASLGPNPGSVITNVVCLSYETLESSSRIIQNVMQAGF